MRVFLSYADADRAWAQKLTAAMQASGLEAWDSAQQVLPGDNWAAKVAAALESSDAMVVLLSPAALASANVRNDIQYALGSPNFKDRLITVNVRAAKNIPWILRELPLVQGVDQSPARVAARIADLLKKHPVAVGA